MKNRYFGSLDDVIEELKYEHGVAKIQEDRFNHANETGKLPGTTGRTTKLEVQVGLKEARTKMRLIENVIEMIGDIDPMAIAELGGKRLPNWTCLTCGSALKPDELIHSQNYCEWKDKTDHPCNNLADYIVTIEGHKILVKAPGGDSIDVKVCRHHLPEVFDKVGQAAVRPVDAPKVEAIDPEPDPEEVQDAFDKALAENGGVPPEKFSIGDL